MIIVGNTIVSDDIVDRCFSCDLSCCRGACCVEGDSGAPLLEEEVPILEAILPEVEPYMTPEGRKAVQQQGVAVRDNDGDLGTPLINGGACAYVVYHADGTALCAIEKAYLSRHQDIETSNGTQAPRLQNGRQDIEDSKSRRLEVLKKPLSCHLYPLRVHHYGEFTAVNYHRWDICNSAKGRGEPLYKYLKEPLIRRFGQEWYHQLLQEINSR
ncbi:MAG: DUF3109 family protein [Bacteroidales bacterium]|nr:DUF3109 family protein [Bacteroidales bacterium]